MDNSQTTLAQPNNIYYLLETNQILFRVLRYEDFLSNPVSEMKNIIDFLNLKSLKNDTIGIAENPRNQTWIQKLSLDQILNIQNAVSV